MNLPRLKELGEHVARSQAPVLDVEPDPEVRERLEQHAAARGSQRPRKGRWAWVAVPALGLSALLAGIGIHARLTDDPLTFAVDEQAGEVRSWVSADTADVPITFSDGSRVVLHEGAKGRVVATHPNGADVVVEAGGASVEVVPRQDTEWQVHSGPFVVHVTGTRFDVDWSAEADRVIVKLHEGSVRVAGCALGQGQSLSAGQQLTATCEDGRVAIGPIAETVGEPERSEAEIADPDEAEATDEDEPRPSTQTAPPPTNAIAGRRAPTQGTADAPDWRSAARASRYAEACQGGRDAALTAAADLLLLGDACRLSGNAAVARQSYETLRSRHAGTGAAARAAFELGRMESRAGRNTQAARWYRAYLTEAGGGALAPAALGRLLEIEIQRGQRSAAKDLAADYLARYPEGAHADAARKVLGKSKAP